MAKQHDDTNRGVLFINDRKETDNHPDLSGKINVDGKEYWLSGWTKKNEQGKFKLLSLSVKPKEANARTAEKAKHDAFDNSFKDDEDFF
jgi:hypothetical protein